jgi:hypothetical protein
MTGEKMEKTRHPRIFIGNIAPYPPETVDRAVSELEQLARNGCGDAIRTRLSALLPESRLAPGAPVAAPVFVPASSNVSRFPWPARAREGKSAIVAPG